MNHVYKVVWSKTKQCYVVASEFAKRSGKATCKAAVLAALVATTAGVAAVPAQASLEDDIQTNKAAIQANKEVIYANAGAIQDNKNAIAQQGEVIKAQGDHLTALSGQVYDNKVANDKKNAEQDAKIDKNGWKADTALKLTGNGVMQNGATNLTTGVNLNTQAIEKEQAARKDADAKLQSQITNNTTAIKTEATERKNADEEIIKSFQAADSQLSSKIDSVDSNSKKGIAGVAALAALHPLDFDPDAKWDFAAGYGNYRGENAAALGAYYRPNEDVMISVGGTIGNSDNNSVNAGLSFKLGAGSSHVNNSRTAMAKEIKDLRDTVSKQDAQIQKLAAMVNALLGTDEKVESTTIFPDIPENHWAYEAVAAMAKNGLVQGYPDGTFKGDRSLTRYEFAQIIYNARQKGAEVDSRLVNEFQKELQYFHIDTVAQDKDGNATIERVRVNK